jgi:tetraacyldisaccharide 4'-kinase
MTPMDMRVMINGLKLFPYQNQFFTRMINGTPQPMFADEAMVSNIVSGSNVLAMVAIGNPQPFVNSLEMRYNVVDKYIVADHHRYNIEDINHLYDLHKKYPRAIILMTEKDAVKLRRSNNLPESMRRAMYYQPIKTTLLDSPDKDFWGKVIDDIEFMFEDKADKKKSKEIILDEEI